MDDKLRMTLGSRRDGWQFASGGVPFGLAVVFAVMLSLGEPVAHGYTPEDPQVQTMIESGIKFLETTSEPDQHAGMLGGKCLVGLACYKHRKDSNHPKVVEALLACQELARASRHSFAHDFNYSLGLAVIFLCELDAQAHSQEIQFFLEQIQSRQRPDGAWSYPNYETGDTSQTQYGVLSSWIASKRGFTVPQSSVEAYCDWLIRTQDPSGAFAYQAKDPGIGNNRVAQDPGPDGIRFTMSPAALGSLYIAADLLGITFQAAPSEEQEIFAKIPAPSAKSNVEVGRLRRAITEGHDYYRRHFQLNLPRNEYYNLYSIERYETFRALALGTEVAEPDWYNQGVEFLAARQADNGSWKGLRGAAVSTGFATLFLMRSTKQTIDLVSDGALIGGRYLPSDLTKVKLQDGQVIGSEVRGDLGSLMELVQSGETLDTQTMLAQFENIRFGNDPEAQSEQLEQLKKMVSGPHYQARLLAVRALAGAGDLKNAPVLIYALGDGDPRVVREAHDGLRLLSRRLSIRALPANPSAAQKRSAQEAWHRWLQGIRPDIHVPDDAFLTVSARDDS